MNARKIDRSSLDAVVAINNAWRIRTDWTYLVHAGDFPQERKPVAGPGQAILSYEAYVPANNAYGGIVHAGGTMAFSTAYWVLDVLRPDIMAFCGCDMIYDQEDGKTHFYGHGSADPLRPDPTLQDLKAKSNRLMLTAARGGCLCVNLSGRQTSRLTFPRLAVIECAGDLGPVHRAGLRLIDGKADQRTIRHAREREAALGLVAPGGDYWNHFDKLDPTELSSIDGLWLSSIRFERLSLLEPVAN